MPKPKTKTASLILIMCIFCISIGLLEFASAVIQGDRPEANSLVISQEIDSTYRYTSEGWQDSSIWSSGDTYVPRQVFERVHPLVWTLLVLCSVIAITIWASSEKDVNRLFVSNAKGKEEVQNENPAAINDAV